MKSSVSPELVEKRPYIFDDGVPKHHQIYMQIRREIHDGLWFNRTDFPGEEELASQYGVSAITSRAALQRLSADGLVQRRRGLRPAVTYVPDEGGADASCPSVFPVASEPFEYEVMALGMAHVPAEACLALNSPIGTPLWRCIRLRRFQGRIHSMSINVQEPDLGARHAMGDLLRHPMQKLLEIAGRPIEKLDRKTTVDVVSSVAARVLSLPLTQSVLVHTYMVKSSDDDPIEWVRIYLHPDQKAPSETLNLRNRTWEELGLV